GLARDGHGKLRRAMDAPRRLAIHVIGRVKVLDFARDVVWHILCVKPGAWARTGFPRQQLLPECLHVVADRRTCAHACNENARHLETHFRLFWERLAGFPPWAVKKGAATAPFCSVHCCVPSAMEPDRLVPLEPRASLNYT